MTAILLLLAFILVYEAGYCHGKKSHNKTLEKRIERIRGIYEKDSKKHGS